MKNLRENSFLRLIQRSHFSKLWASQILTQVGLSLLNFIIVLRIFEKTNSSFAVSLVWLFYALPALLLGPFSGTIIDIFSRRKVLIVSNIAQAAVVLLYLLVRDSIWPLYAVIFIYALFLQLYIPAEAVTLPFLVRKRLLPLANSLFLFTIYASLLVGYGLAGPVIGALGRKPPFLLVSVMLMIAAIAVYLLPDDGRNGKVGSPARFWERFQEGFEFIKRKPAVLLPLLLLVLAGIIVPVIGILAPAIAVNLLRIELLEISTRIMIPLGLGAIGGAFVTIRLLKNRRKKRVIFLGILLAALCVFLLGVVLPGLAMASVLVSILSVFLGASLAMSVVPAQTLLQETTPDKLRGRVFGVLNFAVTIASFLPIISLSALTELLGEQLILLFLSVLLFFVAIAALNFEYILRRIYAKAV